MKNKKLVAAAFNEWMRRYTEEPDKFMHDFETVIQFLKTPKGKEPDYGKSCAAYLAKVMAELSK